MDPDADPGYQNDADYADPDPQHWIIYRRYMFVIILNPPHLKSLLQNNCHSILTFEYGTLSGCFLYGTVWSCGFRTRWIYAVFF